MNADVTLNDRLAGLPPADRRLLVALAALAFGALALGIAGGVTTALARSGAFGITALNGYRALTVHGVAVFFFWLFTAQAALLLALTLAESGRALALRPLAWAGAVLIGAGFVASVVGGVEGTPLLYNGTPELGAADRGAQWRFALGYSALGAGLIAVAVAALATLNAARAGALSAVGFALFTWAGFLVVTGFAALYAFVPGAAWALGLAAFPADHGTRWHIVFHNMHYLPLMATVILWYVLVRELTGVKSIFGERFSKIVFAMYLVFVPPTSLYHMFLEPDLPGVVRVTGSLLSLFVSVPTLTAFLIVVASLEVHARARGARGLFGWIGMLPWRHPAMAAIGAAVLSMGLGLAFAFVLIQEKLAPLLSDTFFVPGYFHFFTVGTVSLTLLAGFAVVLPALGARLPWGAAWLRWMPWLVLGGLLVFGAAGVAAGYLGVPRRVIDASYQQQAPQVWRVLMGAVAVGGSVMAAGLAAFALGIAGAFARRERPAAWPAHWLCAWGGTPIAPATRAWSGPLAVAVIVAAMVAFTVVGFEAMQALPLDARGGGGH